MKLNTLAASVGKGLLAGFVGTAAMTVSSSLEARLRHRAASSAPARATAKVLGIKEFEDARSAARFSNLSHWGYGTGWGVVRGLLAAAGLSPRSATAAHGAVVWGSAAVALPALSRARLGTSTLLLPSPRPYRSLRGMPSGSSASMSPPTRLTFCAGVSTSGVSHRTAGMKHGAATLRLR